MKHYYHASPVAMHLEVHRLLGRRIPLQWKQLLAYNLCVANHRQSHRWLGEQAGEGWALGLGPGIGPCWATAWGHARVPLTFLAPSLPSSAPPAFIDTDEFLMVTEKGKRLVEVMADYENYGGVGVNWRIYSSCKRPSAGPPPPHLCLPAGGWLDVAPRVQSPGARA